MTLSMASVCWRSPSPFPAPLIWPVLQSSVYRGMVSLPAQDYRGLTARGCHPAAVLPEPGPASPCGPGNAGDLAMLCRGARSQPEVLGLIWAPSGGRTVPLLGGSARLGEWEDNAFGGIAFRFVLEESSSGVRTRAQAKTSAHTLHPSPLTTNDRISLTKG